MLVLFETPAGYAVFKVVDDSKLSDESGIWKEYTNNIDEKLQLVSFKKFKEVSDAVNACKSVEDNCISKTLKKTLKGLDSEESLAVSDPKLGALIKEKLNIPCVNNKITNELMRAIRYNMDDLLVEHKTEIDAMRLAFAHSLGRYRVKFNPEKIDTMIVQAVSLIDDLDKELNNYVMRCREWYGWHFPELNKIISDPLAYAKVIRLMGMKQNAARTDFSEILPEELSERVKKEAEISMGTDIAEIDIIHISQLCDEIISLMEYRNELHDYLKNRMNALAPNLTVLLGELIGARLISRAGTLVGLAKYPASTVQLLGAEKGLFRALKTKKATPKYGIIYHAQLVAQASAHAKGKMARKLAAKVSLSARVDALVSGEYDNSLGIEHRAYLEKTLIAANEKTSKKIAGSYGRKPDQKSGFEYKSKVYSYDNAVDSKFDKKRSFNDSTGSQGPRSKKFKQEKEEPIEE